MSVQIKVKYLVLFAFLLGCGATKLIEEANVVPKATAGPDGSCSSTEELITALQSFKDSTNNETEPETEEVCRYKWVRSYATHSQWQLTLETVPGVDWDISAFGYYDNLGDGLPGVTTSDSISISRDGWKPTTVTIDQSFRWNGVAGSLVRMLWKKCQQVTI